MSISRKLLKKIAENCKSLAAQAKHTHLANIAMYIAQEKGCQIFIEPLQKDIEGFVSFVANCDINVTQIDDTGKEENRVSSVQHFIFYKPDKDIEIELARVAHELGHCLLHWPLGSRRKIEEQGVVYLVKFTKKEEEEADAFMCLCLSGLFSGGVPKLPVTQVVGEAYDNIKRYRQKGLLQSEK